MNFILIWHKSNKQIFRMFNVDPEIILNVGALKILWIIQDHEKFDTPSQET